MGCVLGWGAVKMQRNRYSEEFKQRIVQECQQVGNIALVARRHEVFQKTATNRGSNQDKGVGEQPAGTASGLEQSPKTQR